MRKFVLTLLVLLTPFLFAVPIFAKETGEHIVVEEDEVIDKDYFAGGEAVTILGTINGDAYIAGGNITVDGTINGDLLVGGGNVTIRGTVINDIRAAGGQVGILGNVGGNVTVAGGTITIAPTAQVEGSVVLAGGDISVSGPVGRGATLAGGQVTTSGTIGGDVWAGVGNLFLATGTNVSGNLHYISDTEATIAKEVMIAGETSREAPPQKSREAQETGRMVAQGLATGFRTASLLSALIIGFLLIRFFPRFMQTTSDTIQKTPSKSILVGILAYAVFPFVFILLLITIIGIPFAFIFLFGLLILAYISKIFVALFVGQWILKMAKQKTGLYLSLTVGLLIYLLIGFVPVLRAFSFMAFLFIGTGALLLTKKQYYRKLRSENLI